MGRVAGHTYEGVVAEGKGEQTAGDAAFILTQTLLWEGATEFETTFNPRAWKRVTDGNLRLVFGNGSQEFEYPGTLNTQPAVDALIHDLRPDYFHGFTMLGSCEGNKGTITLSAV
jgi:hypothetical protein